MLCDYSPFRPLLDPCSATPSPYYFPNDFLPRRSPFDSLIARLLLIVMLSGDLLGLEDLQPGFRYQF